MLQEGKKKTQNFIDYGKRCNKFNGRVTADEVIHKDSVFRYQLLDRLRSDCEYYLNYGNRHPKSLWAGDEKLQIEFMIKLHESFKEDEKPEWLTMDEILEYSKKMIAQEE